MSFIRNIFRALSGIERRVLWAALACVAVGAVGLVAIFVRDHTVVVPAHGGTYTEGMVGQPSYVNPVLAASDDDQGLVRLVYANLADLAETIEISPDARTVKVRLKQNLEWSDGQPLTSDDVVFTLQFIQDPDSRSPLAGLFTGVTADRASALEIDFHITNTALTSAIPDLRPAPRHLFADVPPANWRLSDYNLRPVSSGPYVFISHDSGADGFISAYRLAANPRYAGTAPYLQRVNVLFFHNSGELVSSFNAGQIQGFGTTDPGLPTGIQRPYTLTRFTTPTVYAVFWNNTANPALGAFEVREALDLVVNRADVIAALGGAAELATGPFPPALFAPDASSTAVSSTAVADPAQILQKKGWAKGDDGVWAKKIGKANVRLEFGLSVPDIGFLKSAAEKLAEEWQAFGAEVHLNVLSPDDALLAAVTNRSYDGLLFGNTVRGSGDLYPFWHSSGRFAPGLNLAVYKNTAVDVMLENLRQERDDAHRQKDMRAVASAITDDEPAVFLFSLDDLYVGSKNVGGVTGGFLENPADRLAGIPQWYVETGRRLK